MYALDVHKHLDSAIIPLTAGGAPKKVNLFKVL